MAKTAKQLLAEYGRTINKKELEQFEKKFDIEKAKEFAKKTPGVSFGPKAKTYYSAGGAAGKDTTVVDDDGDKNPSPGDTNITYDFGLGIRTMSLPEFTYESASALTTLKGSIDKEIENARNASNQIISKITSSADERARKYVADKAKEAGESIETIRGDKTIDLQEIINTGLTNVEQLRKESAKDVETERGTYNVKQEEARQAGGRDIQRIAGRSNIYSGLMGAFNF